MDRMLIEDEDEVASSHFSVTSLFSSPRGARGRVEELEAWRVLMGWTQGTTGAIPARLLVGHVLEVTPGADFGVRRAAMAAVARRLASRKREGLQVASRPPGGEPFGLYATAQARGKKRPYRARLHSARPYQSLLRSVEPLEGSCDCRDFLRNSLGLCKHLLAVLEDLCARTRRFRQAREAGAAAPSRRARLSWCPLRPASGAGDWLARVRLAPGTGKSSAKEEALVREWLVPCSGGEWSGEEWGSREEWAPRSTHAGDPAARLGLVSALLGSVRPPGRRSEDPYALPDPALIALLERERSELSRRLELLESAPALDQALESLERSLYPYQREGVERLLRGGRLLLADDMGLGKTVQAVAGCHALYRSGTVQRGLLIVPASLKSQWLREWKLFSQVPARIVEGTPRGAGGDLPRDARGVLDRELRALAARPRGPAGVGRRGGGLGRSPADQELGHADGAGGQEPHTAVAARPDGHAPGEPAGGAGLHRGLGRRPGPRAEVAVGSRAHDPRGGRARERGRGAEPRHAPRAPRGLHAAPDSGGGPRSAPAAHGHGDPRRAQRGPAGRPRRAQPADRQAGLDPEPAPVEPGGAPAADEPADGPAGRRQRARAAELRGGLADDLGAPGDAKGPRGT